MVRGQTDQEGRAGQQPPHCVSAGLGASPVGQLLPRDSGAPVPPQVHAWLWFPRGARPGAGLDVPTGTGVPPAGLPYLRAGAPAALGLSQFPFPADEQQPRSSAALESRQRGSHAPGQLLPQPGPRSRRRPPPGPGPQPVLLHAGATSLQQPWPSTLRSSTTSQPAMPMSSPCSRTRSWR